MSSLNSTTNAVSAVDLVKRYGRRNALAGLTLSVPSGSIFGLVGSNGAGKTTFMSICAGLLHPHSGTLDILGAGPFNPAIHAGRLTLLPQDSRFPPHARVEELLSFYGRLQGLEPTELATHVARVLDWTHLTDRRQSPIRTLSHGMNRRVAIAQAFLGNPEVVLLDEPLSGLDPRESAHLREILRQQRGQRTILLSSHDLHDIESLCDTVGFVEAGRLVRQGSLDQVVRRGNSLSYLLESSFQPPDAVRAMVPGSTWETSANGRELTVSFADAMTPAAVNRIALRGLLDAGAEILEVRRGSNLEKEYLAMSAPPPVPPERRKP
jgi:ABC-2 type transport system ATP-binding protein